jgi:hypothetical protein
MSKAGKGDGVDAGAVGSQHPVPENIPHLTSPVNGGGAAPKHGSHHGSIASGAQAGSPIKESSFLNRETSAEEDPAQAAAPTASADGAAKTEDTDKEPLAAGEGIPIRG